MLFGNLSPLMFYKPMKKLLISLSFITLLLIGSPTNAAGALSSEIRDKINDNTTQLNDAAGYNGDTDILSVAKNVIVIILSLLAVIFLFLIIYAGFKWMTAEGDADDIKKAKATIKTSIIGLLIVLASYGFTYFLFSQITFFSGVAPTPNTPTEVQNGGL